MRRKVMAFLLIIALLLLPACGNTTPNTRTPEELADRYAAAIQAARTEEDYPPEILTNTSDYHFFPVEEMGDLTEEELTSQFEDYKAVLFQLTGLDPEQMDAYALAISLMNIRVDAVALIMPKAGQEQAVLDAVNAYVTQVQRSFEHYLPDQYEVSLQAQVETLADGTIALVMCPNSSAVWASLQQSLA